MAERTLTGKKYTRSKEEREEEIKRLGAKRDKWQMNHLGNFEPIYPSQDLELTKKYEQLLIHS